MDNVAPKRIPLLKEDFCFDPPPQLMWLERYACREMKKSMEGDIPFIMVNWHIYKSFFHFVNSNCVMFMPWSPDDQRTTLVNSDVHEAEQMVLRISCFREGIPPSSMQEGYTSPVAYHLGFKLKELYLVPYIFQIRSVLMEVFMCNHIQIKNPDGSLSDKWEYGLELRPMPILIEERWMRLKELDLIHTTLPHEL